MRANSILVSIIIPVYNVERYIDECLESVLRQDYPNIEVIIVNDQTPDNSMQIVEKHLPALKGKGRTTVLEHSVNQGLSAARNSGIAAASGNYLFFLDSDDRLMDNSISALVREANKHNNPELIFGHYIHSHIGEVYQYPIDGAINGFITGNEAILKNFFEHKLFVMAWSKLFSREFLLSNDLKFQEGILHEDILFSYKAALKAEHLAICDEATYWYRVSAVGSICSSKYSKRNIDSYLFITKRVIELFDKPYLRDKFAEYIYGYCYYILCLAYEKKVDGKSEIIDELRNIIRSIEKVKIKSWKTGIKKNMVFLPKILCHLVFPLVVFIKNHAG